jgi:hypothetical protein
MEITLGELTILQSALVNVKAFLKNLEEDTNQLDSKVEEAYQIVMNKIDRDPFEHGGPEGRI